MLEVYEIFIAALLWIDFTSSARLGTIHPCNPDIKPPEFYNRGERIDLCCEVSSRFIKCHEHRLLSIKHNNHSLAPPTESNHCSITLTIPKAQASDMGIYSCYFNGSHVGSLYVRVLATPSKPKILRKKIYPKHKNTKFIVTFDPGNMTNFDNITVYGQTDKGTRNLTPWCKNDSFLNAVPPFVCRYEYGKPYFSRNMSISIVNKRLRDSAELTERFNPYLFIKPRSVIKLKVFAITARTANITFCQHRIMNDLVPEMFNMSHRFLFQMIKSQGVREQHRASINLVPFTKYIVRVNAVSSAGRSATKEATFATKDAAPMLPPQEVLYWTSSSFKSPDEKSMVLLIAWRPIPHDSMGGTIYYRVEMSDGNLYVRQRNVSSFYVVFDDVPYHAGLTIKIWSVNDISSSANFSELIIPPDGIIDSTPFESHVELQMDQALALVKAPFPSWRVWGLHYCRGRLDQNLNDLVRCQEFPHVDDSIQDSRQEAGILNHTIVLRGNPENESYTYRKETFLVNRCKESLCAVQKKVTVKIEKSNMQNTYYAFNESDKNPLKFFVSFISKDTRMVQLFPVSCYYDKSKDEVKLKYEEISKDEKRILAWRQKCDPDSPTQYLADSYDVFVAKSSQCKHAQGDVSTLKQSVFDQTKFDLPHRDTHVCIKAVRANGNNYGDFMYVGEVSDAKQPNWLFVIFGILMILCLLVAVFGCMFYYRKRYSKVPKKPGENLTHREDFAGLRETFMYTTIPVNADERYEKDSGLTGSVSYPNQSSSTSMTFSEGSTGIHMPMSHLQDEQAATRHHQHADSNKESLLENQLSSGHQGQTDVDDMEDGEMSSSSTAGRSAEMSHNHLQKLIAQLQETAPL